MEPKSWGVENLTVKERIKKVVDAGVDQFGGNDNISELLELFEEGQISEARINESAKRLLRVKFKLGLFDNPFVAADKAEIVVGNPDFVEKGKLAQRKSIVLLKNSMNNDSTFLLPLKKNLKIYIENITAEIASGYATVVDSVADADVAILRLQTPWEPRNGDMVEKMFHQGKLDFDDAELARILKITEKKPTVICMYLDRPAIIPEIAEKAAGLLGDFGAYDDAVLDIVFGNFNPSAKLPFEMPSSMEAVKNQKEDVPFDSENPVFKFGFGLSYR
jgi:beta-glucosidase